MNLDFVCFETKTFRLTSKTLKAVSRESFCTLVTKLRLRTGAGCKETRVKGVLLHFSNQVPHTPYHTWYLLQAPQAVPVENFLFCGEISSHNRTTRNTMTTFFMMLILCSKNVKWLLGCSKFTIATFQEMVLFVSEVLCILGLTNFWAIFREENF